MIHRHCSRSRRLNGAPFLTCISENVGETEYCFCELWSYTNDCECCYLKLLRIRYYHSVNQTLLNLIINSNTNCLFYMIIFIYDMLWWQIVNIYTFPHQLQWEILYFFLNLKWTINISSSTSMDIFTIHNHPQWIFSNFLINHDQKLSYIIILTRVTYATFPPFKPCGIWHVSLTLNYLVKTLTFGLFCFVTYLLELIS